MTVQKTNFDVVIDRGQTDSVKWNMYGEGVLPLWVADMDFQAPQPVIDALKARVEQGVYGYQGFAPALRQLLVERLKTRHNMDVQENQIVFTPGLVFALNVTVRMVGNEGDGVMLNTPIYPPFLSSIQNQGKTLVGVELKATVDAENIMRYELDFDALEAAITPQTKLFMFCNPHNPIGRVYTREELEKLAAFIIKHDLILVTDEIHCDLLAKGQTHISIASLSSEIADRTITLLAPSKTFNIPGLGLGFVVIQNEDLRKKFQKYSEQSGGFVNLFGYTGALAAYRDSQPWLDDLLVYLEDNRDLLVDYVSEHFPECTITKPEGTYLAWMDCRPLNLPDVPYQFFLKEAKVACNDGITFGQGGEGFIRINYGCSRSTLLEALERMREALGR